MWHQEQCVLPCWFPFVDGAWDPAFQMGPGTQTFKGEIFCAEQRARGPEFSFQAHPPTAGYQAMYLIYSERLKIPSSVK